MASDLRTEDTNNDGYKPIALHYLSVHDLSVQEQAVNRSLYTDESGATRLPYLTLDASAVSSSLSSDHEKRSLSSLQAETAVMYRLMTGLGSGPQTATETWQQRMSTADLNSYTYVNYGFEQRHWTSMSYEQRLLATRDSAAAFAATGYHALDQGPQLHADSMGGFHLGIQDTDLGGRGVLSLVHSRDSAMVAAKLTEAMVDYNKNLDSKVLVHGEQPSKQEAEDLRRFAKTTNNNINALLTEEHDVAGAFRNLLSKPNLLDDGNLKALHFGSTATINYIEQTNRQKPIQTQNTDGSDKTQEQIAEQQETAHQVKELLAKLYRDQALVYIAAAQDRMNKGTFLDSPAALLFGSNEPLYNETGLPRDGALSLLRQSQKLAPGNSDLKAVGKLYNQRVRDMAGKYSLPPEAQILDLG